MISHWRSAHTWNHWLKKKMVIAWWKAQPLPSPVCVSPVCVCEVLSLCVTLLSLHQSALLISSTGCLPATLWVRASTALTSGYTSVSKCFHLWGKWHTFTHTAGHLSSSESWKWLVKILTLWERACVCGWMYFLSLGRYCIRVYKCLCIIVKCYLESMCTFTALLSISHYVGEQFRTFTVSSSSVHYLHSIFTLCGRLLSAFFLCDTVIFLSIATGPWERPQSQITTYTTLVISATLPNNSVWQSMQD